jgi:hypothetical protein
MEALKDPRNLEKYKEDIYTQQHLMNMAKDMSFKSYEQEIKSNPYMQMFMQKQNYNLDVIKYKDNSIREWAGYDLRVRAQNFSEFSSNRDYKYKVDKDNLENPPPVITTTTLPTITTPKTVDDQWAVSTEKDELMKGLKNKYAERLFPGLNNFQQRQSFVREKPPIQYRRYRQYRLTPIIARSRGHTPQTINTRQNSGLSWTSISKTTNHLRIITKKVGYLYARSQHKIFLLTAKR